MEKNQEQRHKNLPVNKVEDVEFSRELADQEDLEALERAEKADRRQQESE
ncbi:YfhD family protein [Paenibacillus septentrionalis]|uniref:YfhD family protein n=1 Tax=Paenibacillus septentrionalis TaxID=429342 RepID=A0ABW1V353_9BACL